MKLGTALLLSAGIMPASLSPVNAGTPDALVQAHHQRCGKPVFYAQTVNHKRGRDLHHHPVGIVFIREDRRRT